MRPKNASTCLIALALVSTPGLCVEAAAKDAAAKVDYSSVPRLQFNQWAVERNEPLFWIRDVDGDGAIDPAELAVTWGPGDARLGRYVADGQFTPAFADAFARIATPMSFDGLSASERARRQAVQAELAQGRPTLVLTTLTAPRDVQLGRREPQAPNVW